MSKVPLSEQIDAIVVACGRCREHSEVDPLLAAIATLRWVEKHAAELRILGEFPGARIVTPQATGLSAIAQERDERGGE